MKNRNIISTTILLALACFAISPMAQAVVPAPDGGYGPPAYGTGNTAEGQNALLSLTTGSYNTGVGLLSLRSNTTTSLNTAIGAGALLANTADENTATGAVALFHNTTGRFNTANGAFSLFNNTTADANTATGFQALFSNTTETGNTAIGLQALFNNTSFNNTAIGNGALYQNTTGHLNTALGAFAGFNVTTANDVIAIGTDGANVSNSCYIGQIFGQPVDPATAVLVQVDTNGKLGTMLSSQRFKHDIKRMDKSSEAVLALKPVTFHYKSDAKGTPQFGLIAEEVAEVNPDLVVRDKEGKPYSVRYDQVNAMLLNEFLKEHKAFLEERGKVEQLEKQVKKLTAGLRKLSLEIEMSKAEPNLVLNSP